MTVKIDGVEPNIFPDVDDLDARDAGRHVEVFLDVSVDGKPTPVTVKLSYEQASDLASLLEPFRKEWVTPAKCHAGKPSLSYRRASLAPAHDHRRDRNRMLMASQAFRAARPKIATPLIAGPVPTLGLSIAVGPLIAS